MTLQEAQTLISSTEFVLWKVKIEKDYNRNEKQDYYLAQIAREVRSVLAKNPQEIQVSDFLIEFDTPNFKAKKKEPKKLTEQQKTAQQQIHKSKWLGIVGYGKSLGEKLLGKKESKK